MLIFTCTPAGTLDVYFRQAINTTGMKIAFG